MTRASLARLAEKMITYTAQIGEPNTLGIAPHLRQDVIDFPT